MIVGEALRLELNFSFLQSTLLKSFVLGDPVFLVAVDNLVLLEILSEMHYGFYLTLSIHQEINSVPLVEYWYSGSFSFEYYLTSPNGTNAIEKEQPSKMQGEHWILIAKSSHILFFAESLGFKNYNFLKQHYKQLMRDPLPLQRRVFSFESR